MTLNMPPLRLIREGEYPDPDAYPIGGLCAYCGHGTGKECVCVGCAGGHGKTSTTVYPRLSSAGVERLYKAVMAAPPIKANVKAKTREYDAVMEGDRRHD